MFVQECSQSTFIQVHVIPIDANKATDFLDMFYTKTYQEYSLLVLLAQDASSPTRMFLSYSGLLCFKMTVATISCNEILLNFALLPSIMEDSDTLCSLLLILGIQEALLLPCSQNGNFLHLQLSISMVKFNKLGRIGTRYRTQQGGRIGWNPYRKQQLFSSVFLFL